MIADGLLMMKKIEMFFRVTEERERGKCIKTCEEILQWKRKITREYCWIFYIEDKMIDKETEHVGGYSFGICYSYIRKDWIVQVLFIFLCLYSINKREEKEIEQLLCCYYERTMNEWIDS